MAAYFGAATLVAVDEGVAASCGKLVRPLVGAIAAVEVSGVVVGGVLRVGAAGSAMEEFPG
jgi:hypothetical protein